MSTLSPKEFRSFVRNMSEEYKEANEFNDYEINNKYEDTDIVEQDNELYELTDIVEKLKKENGLLKKTIKNLTKENMQLYTKCKHYELNEKGNDYKKEKEPKELPKIDSAYFRKKLNL